MQNSSFRFPKVPFLLYALGLALFAYVFQGWMIAAACILFLTALWASGFLQGLQNGLEQQNKAEKGKYRNFFRQGMLGVFTAEDLILCMVFPDLFSTAAKSAACLLLILVQSLFLQMTDPALESERGEENLH